MPLKHVWAFFYNYHERKSRESWRIVADFWVRCTINRSHSTPCKKAEFEHLQIFPGHCLDFFLSVSGKICHSPIKKVKRQPTLIISFSQLGNSQKIRAEIRAASDVTWGVRRGVCDKIVYTKMHFSASA